MLNDENKQLCWDVLARYGIVHQQNMVIEECAELQKAVCKLHREENKNVGKFRVNYIEELVDVIVMCEQMLLVEDINDAFLNNMARIKLERALGRRE